MQIEGKEITGYFKSYNKSWGYSAIHTRFPTSDDALYRLVDRPEAYMIDVHTLDMPSEHTQLVHWQFCFSITVRAGSQQIHNSLVSEDLEAMNEWTVQIKSLDADCKHLSFCSTEVSVTHPNKIIKEKKKTNNTGPSCKPFRLSFSATL